MCEKSKWASDETVGAQRFIRVRHTETGAVGYRSLRWQNGRATAYGGVYSTCDCTTEVPNCELLVPVNGIGALAR